MKKKITFILLVLLTIAFSVFNVSCEKNKTNENQQSSFQSQNVAQTAEDQKAVEKKEVVLSVYNTSLKKIVKMPLEEYLQGVVAGEMFNTWNDEALKAQAILARTYTMHFIENNKSKYEGADISTDISEAQAYDASAINAKIKNAVNSTKGLVLKCDGEFIKAWFHANSGGKTTTAKVGLGYRDDEPKYIKSVWSPETEENSKNYSWTATMKKTDILNALRKMGISVSNISSFSVGEKSQDGRAITLKIGSKEVSASTFRINYGSTIMKSCWITSVKVGSSSVVISGRGYGHGVGMSQWGAQVLAEKGKTAKEILFTYFDNVELTSI